MIKKLIFCLTVLLILITAGCNSPKEKEAPKTPDVPEPSHLTAENNGLLLSVSPRLRFLPALNDKAGQGKEAASLQVTIDNNSKNPISISPAFVVLETTDNETYRFSDELTRSVTGKASFKTTALPPGYRGGGLLIFEIKKGAKIKYLLYDDSKGHYMKVQYPSKSEEV